MVLRLPGRLKTKGAMDVVQLMMECKWRSLTTAGLTVDASSNVHVTVKVLSLHDVGNYQDGRVKMVRVVLRRTSAPALSPI